VGGEARDAVYVTSFRDRSIERLSVRGRVRYGRFHCNGDNNAGAQEVLEGARDRLHQNEDVLVQIIPEPENPVDKAFKCRILIVSGLGLDML